MSYTSYVASNPDLKKAFEKSGAKSAASWGKSHWEKHGSGESRAKTPHNTSGSGSGGGGGGGGSSSGGGGGASGGSYTAYVNKYPDLKAAFEKSGAKSAEAWGKSHFLKHGSGEGRTVGGVRLLGTTTSSRTSGGDSGPFVRTRMGYDPSAELDYTNTNPAYWASAVSYFKGKPEGNPVTGELGIWIPNFEKEGAERTALAAVAGGVTAHVDSNYSNNTVDDAKAKALHAARGDAAGAAGSYRGGAEKAIRLAGVHRGGTDVDTGHPMGSTDSSEHGVYIKGGKVVKGAGADYVKGGGDFGGLLSVGDSITGSWLDGILGGMDKDGMRLGGTYAPVRGAAGSGVGAGGTATGMGTFYGGGTDPLAKMPGVADYTPYIDPNSVFGGRSGNAAVRSGLLYQPMASDYGAKMAGAGMPVFSPTGGLLGSPGGMGGVKIGGVGAPTYGAAPGGFSPAAIAAAGGGTATVGTSAGLRDGMTAGMHSTHLGAYQLGDGSWVWGDRPSASGDSAATDSSMGHGGPYAGSPFAGVGIPSVASVFGPGIAALGGLLSGGSAAHAISSGADVTGESVAEEAAAEHADAVADMDGLPF